MKHRDTTSFETESSKTAMVPLVSPGEHVPHAAKIVGRD